MTTPFLDNFNGEASNIDLAAHVPSGGTAWTRVDGTAGMAQVSASSSRLINATTNATGALYQCDDQGGADHYVQYVCENGNISAYVCNRASDANNFIGVRVFNSRVQLWRRSGGTLTQLGSDGVGSVGSGAVIRLESVGETHTVFVNGEQKLQSDDSTNSTISRQGVVARTSGSVGWLDNFEAGSIAASGGASGTLSATETGADTASIAGAVGVAGALAAAESGADTAAFAGAVAVSGSLAASEAGNDVAALSGTAAGPITGALAATEEGADTASFRGPIVEQEAATGGWFRLPQQRFRTQDEIDDERRRLGILPPKVAEVVKEVAREAAQQPAARKAEIRRDFKRELAEAQAQYRAEYLRALYAEIEFQRLLQQQAEEEEEAVAVLLMALAA